MKRSLLIIGALMLLLTSCAVHYDESNISRLYDSEWIIGKSRDEVVEKYGEFDREFVSDDGEEIGAWYVNRYDGAWLDENNMHDTFFVVFEDDFAAAAYFEETSRGG